MRVLRAVPHSLPTRSVVLDAASLVAPSLSSTIARGTLLTGMHPQATERKKLIEAGKLDKHGRANDKTPAGWKASYVDLRCVSTCRTTVVAVCGVCGMFSG